MKRAAWLVEACLFIVFSLPLAALPLQWSLKSGELLGLLLFYLWTSRRKIAIDNLTKSSLYPDSISVPPGNVIRENFKNMGRSFMEVLKVYCGFGKKIIDSIHLEGTENFRKAKANGKGVLFITGHCGNWELLALSAASHLSDTISIVARPLDNPYLNRLIEYMRKKYGNSIIYKKGALKPILQALRSNGCVGILMDQAVVRDEGFVINFLGRGAWTTKMPALIARKTGAAVLPVFIHRTGTGHVINIYPEIELSRSDDREGAVRDDTIMFSGYIEQYIAKHPAEWLWIHRRWKRVKQEQATNNRRGSDLTR
jgi:KDO2-lipid IV(A) lauroyltransferase